MCGNGPPRALRRRWAATILAVSAPQLCGRVADKSGPDRVSPEGIAPYAGSRERLDSPTAACRRSTVRPALGQHRPYGCQGAIRADIRGEGVRRVRSSATVPSEADAAEERTETPARRCISQCDTVRVTSSKRLRGDDDTPAQM